MKKFIKFFIALISAGIAITYFVCSLTPYVSQADFWPLSFLSLGFVFIAIPMFAVTIFWLFKNVRIGLVFILILLFGYRNLAALYAFNFSSFQPAKKEGSLRILDWNARRFVENGKKYDWPYAVRRKMFAFIKEMDPDVILMQEFVEMQGKDYYSNLKLFDSLGYKYSYFPKDDHQVRHDLISTFGSIIISKTPITDTQRYLFPSSNIEGIVMGDIEYNGKKIRLATMHLASLALGAPDDRGEFYGRVDKNFLLRRTRMQNLKYNDILHAEQAAFVRALLDESPHPVILSGDFNSVPGSYTYHKVKGDMKDSFIEKGYGFGRTFSGLSPTLRIDYILVDKSFKVEQYTSPALYLSDHFPVVADVKWK